MITRRSLLAGLLSLPFLNKLPTQNPWRPSIAYMPTKRYVSVHFAYLKDPTNPRFGMAELKAYDTSLRRWVTLKSVELEPMDPILE